MKIYGKCYSVDLIGNSNLTQTFKLKLLHATIVMFSYFVIHFFSLLTILNG